jgi:hypothetical protein
MFYIMYGNDTFTIIDCCMCDEDKSRIVKELKSKSEGKSVTRFKATKPNPTEDFEKYCALRNSDKAFCLFKKCSRKWFNDGNEE